MDGSYVFTLHALDPSGTRLQLRDMLEKLVEVQSRKKYPGMWKLGDRLNARRRGVPRKKGILLPLMNWALGIVLLMPGLMQPRELFLPLIAGAVAFGAGCVGLWMRRKRLLGILCILQGLFLCFGGFVAIEELGCMLILGVPEVILGIAALVTSFRKKQDPFLRSADRLLDNQPVLPEGQETRVVFSETGMALPEEPEPVPYSGLSAVIISRELLLLVFGERYLTLQKTDLTQGEPAQLVEYLRSKTAKDTVWTVA